MKLAEQTVSLWSYLNRPDVLQSFLNPMYDPNNRVIWPSVAPMSLVRSSFRYVGVLISVWLFLFPVFVFAAQPKEFFLDGLNKL
jgi:hypothetical protein